MIVIVDYGMGNVGSIQNMVKKAGSRAVVSSEHSDIEAASKLILPGVGSFDHGMSNLRERQLLDLLHRKAMEEKTPILGICLGMQLMTLRSEEGKLPGLGWFDAETLRFQLPPEMKVPHMGWNRVTLEKESPLFRDMPEDPRFYFVHSFFVKCRVPGEILTRTHYGLPFTSAIQKENLFATQFHPEKSHKYGLTLIKNFVEMT